MSSFVLTLDKTSLAAVDNADATPRTWKAYGANNIAFSNASPAWIKFKYESISGTTREMEMKLSLNGASFTREMYKPGHVQAEVLIEPVTANMVNLNDLKQLFIRRSVFFSYDTHCIATNYYIHEISPQFETKKEEESGIEYDYIYVKLDIFSMDKLLTLNKFSRAHLGRRLVGDIVNGMIKDFPLAYGGQLSTIPFRPVSSSSLQKLAYTSSGSQVEFVHPYLVQYNETFHDFLSRVANRCGEAMYFENGQLCFGLAKSPAVWDNSTLGAIKRVVYQQITEGPLTVHDYARDTVKGFWNETAATDDKTLPTLTVDYALQGKNLNGDPLDNDVHNFPADAFSRLVKGQENHYPHFYNNEVSSEDYYLILYKDKFAVDTFPDIWWGKTDEHLLEWLSDILNSTSLLELLATFGRKSIELAIKCALKKNSVNDSGNAVVEKEAKSSSDNYAVLYSDVDKDKSHWVTLNYYTDIKAREEEQMRQMVYVDMGDTLSTIKLGDKVKLPKSGDQEYVVVKIEMTSANEWQRSYDGGPKPSAAQSLGFWAIPLYPKNASTHVFYPPLLPGKPFREAGPQPAFVVDSEDFTGQGRVRIRFAWQNSLKLLDDAVEKYTKDIEDDKKNVSDTRSELEKYANVKEDKDGKYTITRHDGVQEDNNDFKNAKTAFEGAVTQLEDDESALKEAKKKRADQESASPWIRMTSPMATEGGGMYFRPEKGDEVMVDFENGNVERPYVTGTLYSKNLTVPEAGNRVIVSRNGHTIKMTDPSNAADFVAGIFPGFKFITDYGIKVPGLEGHSNKILGGIELTDQLGFYNIKMSSHDRNISISSPFGDVNIDALTGISIKAPNGDIDITGKNVNITAYNKINMTSGKNVKMGIDKGRAGYFSSILNTKDLGKTISKNLIGMTVGKFFDLSLIRTLLEIFVRPVDGTLEIKSNRYLLMEAGKGSAMAEFSAYNTKWEDQLASRFEFKHETPILEQLINVACEKVDRVTGEYIRAFNAVVGHMGGLLRLFADHLPQNARTATTPADSATFIKDVKTIGFRSSDNIQDSANDYFDNHMTFSSPEIKNRLAVGVKEQLKNALTSISLLKNAKDNFLKVFDSLNIETDFANIPGWKPESVRKILKSDFMKDAAPILSLRNPEPDAASAATQANPLSQAPAAVAPYGPYGNLIKPLSELNTHPMNDIFDDPIDDNTFDDWKKVVKRRLICFIIERCRDRATNPFKHFQILPSAYEPILNTGVGDVGGTSLLRTTVTDTKPANLEHPFSDADWARYINDIRLDAIPLIENKFLKGLAEGAIGALKKAVPWESDGWNTEREGEIIFSNEATKSYRFNAMGPTEVYANPLASGEDFLDDQTSLRTLLNSK